MQAAQSKTPSSRSRNESSYKSVQSPRAPKADPRTPRASRIGLTDEESYHTGKGRGRRMSHRSVGSSPEPSRIARWPYGFTQPQANSLSPVTLLQKRRARVREQNISHSLAQRPKTNNKHMFKCPGRIDNKSADRATRYESVLSSVCIRSVSYT